jgi:biotin transport system substrate-specific component
MKQRTKAADAAFTAAGAALIAICSWITFPLTVPITLQTLGVCLVAGILGAKKGLAATAVYILVGAAGVPVFHGFTGGAGILLGNTGGYIIGFIFTALITGLASDRYGAKPMPLILSMTVGVLVCYAFGTVWFAVLYAKTGGSAGIMTILGWCVFPFIIPDAIKIAAAAFLTARLKPLIKSA